MAPRTVIPTVQAGIKLELTLDRVTEVDRKLGELNAAAADAKSGSVAQGEGESTAVARAGSEELRERHLLGSHGDLGRNQIEAVLSRAVLSRGRVE